MCLFGSGLIGSGRFCRVSRRGREHEQWVHRLKCRNFYDATSGLGGVLNQKYFDVVMLSWCPNCALGNNMVLGFLCSCVPVVRKRCFWEQHGSCVLVYRSSANGALGTTWFLCSCVPVCRLCANCDFGNNMVLGFLVFLVFWCSWCSGCSGVLVYWLCANGALGTTLFLCSW